MHLTPDALRACYDFYRTLPPFKSWNLPEGESVAFCVGRDPNSYGWYREENGTHTITVSSRLVGHVWTLCRTMAHEMIHLRQAVHRTEPSGKIQHNAEFRRLAAKVCAMHGYDPQEFV